MHHRLLRKLFGITLDRMRLERGVWSTFTTFAMPTGMPAGVLIGRAAYTSHFSVGLDIRSQLEDARCCATTHADTNTSRAQGIRFHTPAEGRQPATRRIASLMWFDTCAATRKASSSSPFRCSTNTMRITLRHRQSGP